VTETPPSRQLTVFFVAVMLITMFFILFAYFFLGQGGTRFAAPGSSWRRYDGDERDEVPVATTPAGLQPVKQLDRGLPGAQRGRYIPQTAAERAYFAAVEKARSRKTRVLARRERRERLEAFLESPLGQNMQATFELARRGNADSAKKFIDQLLEDLVEMDVEIQRYVVQSALSIYYHDKDKPGLARMMVRYLGLAKQHGTAGTRPEQMDDWIREIEGKMGELQRSGP